MARRVLLRSVDEDLDRHAIDTTYRPHHISNAVTQELKSEIESVKTLWVYLQNYSELRRGVSP